MSRQQVVGALLLRDPDEGLLCLRSAHRERYPAVWDVAGGHVEPGEQPLAALAREVREELGIGLATENLSAGPDLHVATPSVDLAVWLVRSWDGEPVNAAPEEHDEIRWVPLEVAVDMDLAHASYYEWLASLRHDV